MKPRPRKVAVKLTLPELSALYLASLAAKDNAPADMQPQTLAELAKAQAKLDSGLRLLVRASTSAAPAALQQPPHRAAAVQAAKKPRKRG